jgi:zinc transport system permease protein
VDIFVEPFFQRALLGGVLIALMAPFLGMFLVPRRLSMIGDTLAHVAIAGVALGVLIDVYPLAVGLGFAVLASFAIEKLRKAYKTYAELSIAIIMAGGVALATFLFTQSKNFNLNVQSYFFGSIYTLNWTDLWLIFAVTAAVLIWVGLFYKELFLMTLDEDAAAVNGLPVPGLNLMMTILTALVIGTAIKIVGALLVSALLIIPVACSLVLAKSFRQSLLLSLLFSEAAFFIGLVAAGIWNTAPGATVVLTLILFLISILAVKRGLRF